LMWVSLAGPAMNFIIAAILGILLRVVIEYQVPLPLALGRMLFFGVFINLALGFFNLIPIPPLDGSKILAGLLPDHLAYRFLALERTLPMLLFLIIILDNFVLKIGLISRVVFPPVRFFFNLIVGQVI